MFIVYTLIHPTTLQPFYVGMSAAAKGRHIRRPYDHIREAKRSKLSPAANMLKINVIRKILMDGLEPIIEITEMISKAEALTREEELIEIYGRRNIRTGILTNLTDGGQAGNGHVMSDEGKQKLRDRLKGKTLEEIFGVEKALAIIMKRRIQMTGAGSPTFGVGHSLEARANISKNRTGKGHDRIISEEQKESIRHSNTVMKTGIPLSDTHKNKISQSLIGKTKGRAKSLEMRLKLSKAKKGKKFDFKKHHWHHSDHGNHHCSRNDLHDLFPNQKLNLANLCRVVSGHNSHHKGWSLSNLP